MTKIKSRKSIQRLKIRSTGRCILIEITDPPEDCSVLIERNGGVKRIIHRWWTVRETYAFPVTADEEFPGHVCCQEPDEETRKTAADKERVEWICENCQRGVSSYVGATARVNVERPSVCNKTEVPLLLFRKKRSIPTFLSFLNLFFLSCLVLLFINHKSSAIPTAYNF